MTDLSNIGVAISDSYVSGYPAANAYDGSIDTAWIGGVAQQASGVGVNGVAYIGRNFGKKCKVQSVIYTPPPTSVFAWSVYGSVTSVLAEHSDNGIDWTTINAAPVANTPNTTTIAIDDYPDSEYFRLRANSALQSATNYNWAVADISLLGTISAITSNQGMSGGT